MDLEDLKLIFSDQIDRTVDAFRFDLIDFAKHPTDDLQGLLKKLKDDYEWAGNKPYPVFVKKESVK